jgi:hypothetical protein
MKIDAYSFGSITIEGKTFTSDVVIYPDRVDPSWWREEGHRLAIIDLEKVLKAEPEVLIIGTGYAGLMSVPDQVRNFLVSKGIELRVEKTTKAVDLYNEARQAGQKVVAAFHLTC